MSPTCFLAIISPQLKIPSPSTSTILKSKINPDYSIGDDVLRQQNVGTILPSTLESTSLYYKMCLRSSVHQVARRVTEPWYRLRSPRAQGVPQMPGVLPLPPLGVLLWPPPPIGVRAAPAGPDEPTPPGVSPGVRGVAPGVD